MDASIVTASQCATMVFLFHSFIYARGVHMKIKLIGIDLAKNVFQVCAINQAGKVLFNHEVRRHRLAATIAQFPSTLIAMESCSSSHYWARTFQAMGHQVVLVPAQHVRPFVRVGKSDARDALAICEAAQRPGLHGVPVKSVPQQDMQLLHRSRQLQVQQVTALANQIRGVAREYGVIFPVGLSALMARIPDVLEDGSNELSPIARQLLADHYHRLRHGRQLIKDLQQQITQLATEQPAFAALQAVPGIGPLTASAFIAAIGNGRQFRRGRQVAAWLGLVPRQYGTGGAVRLQGMTKNGDRYLRYLLICGARSAIAMGQKNCPPLAEWIQPIMARRGGNKAVVALANKLARIAWVIVSTGEPFDLKRAFKPAA
jgi:transposase